MAAYQFPDNELQEIELLVTKITGGSIGLNQLFNPDESFSVAGEHATKILECLQNMRAAIETEDYEDIDALLAAVREYDIEKSAIKLTRTDSNPLFIEVVKKSQEIVANIKQDSYHRMLFRKIELIDVMKLSDNNFYAIQAVSDIRKMFEDTINELQNINPPRKGTDEKKSVFSRFFSNSNKVAPAPVQRGSQKEIDEAIHALKSLANELPPISEAVVTLRITLREDVDALSKYIDDMPTNASPLVYNAISRLSAGLQTHLLNINDPDRKTSQNSLDIIGDFMKKEFDLYLRTAAGQHYMHTLIRSEDSSPYKVSLTAEELDNFHSTDYEDLTDKMVVLLTLLPQDRYEDLYDKMEAVFESHVDYLIEKEPSVEPSGKTPRIS